MKILQILKSVLTVEVLKSNKILGSDFMSRRELHINVDSNNINNEHNESIQCVVDECKFHCKHDDYCTLNQIHVTKHASEANEIETTDCGSFERM